MFQAQHEYLIIPGWQGSSTDHWQSHWENILKPSSRLNVKSWDLPEPDDWVQQLDDHIQQSHSPLVLIAHSLGCIAVARWASQARQEQLGKVKAALLVAPADVERADCPGAIAGFAPISLCSLPFHSLVIGSTTDNTATEHRIRAFANAWGSQCEILHEAGHINATSGHHQWPEGFKYIEKLTQTIAA